MYYDLNRFELAQEGCYEQARAELQNGKKESHWMWFIFPQIAGLGRSKTARAYEIADIREAEEYLKNEILSKRLVELVNILLHDIKDSTAEEIFGYPDYLKFHSCLTLFYMVVQSRDLAQHNKDLYCFEEALEKYYGGELDALTLAIAKQPFCK